MFHPDKNEFIQMAARGNLIPVYKEILADMETPVSIMKKISDNDFAFLLESVEGGESLGRYSFLGANPSIIFKSKGREIDLIYRNDEETYITQKSPLDELRNIMSRFKLVPNPSLPPFIGGAVGYVSYDEIRNIEPRIPNNNPDDLNLPDTFFMITDNIIIFDHVRHRILLLNNAHIRGNPEKAYEEAIRQIELMHEKLRLPLPAAEIKREAQPIKIESNMTEDEFKNAVERAREYIFAGDIFQVVLSQRLKTNFTCAPLDIYRALRAINPSPYMFFLKFGGLKIIGSSPEILVKVAGDQIQIRPIAGTRKRGSSPDEDKALEAELLADPKERAEHIMLVDLGRNDCGRVAEFGSVFVDDLMTIERYSHVMHIVSNVRGTLAPKNDAYDVLKASFPAGTVSGAPKVRAMEIIDELETIQRGPYAGAVGYFSFSGNLDSCITIRTIITRGDSAYIQAGCGVVADSVPETEYQETLNKARALIRAIEMAEAGLE
ncbi:MAG TPA: anthranilate synthase component I [Candidatus Sumerlaeota bacterium]|nr:MAG: Anthranilate synthase component 1 [candidate division BRC1 bacterium ADurb.Bin183]HOE63424.1 anthranilate synthase component I [Candidatus Sumerlaeota bacterium]HRR30290.1 anthranilate synthase component I [Candidatus Sumerlaeia bacterium]HON50903.1 anthranilate synthase component I [Candidatus Sumerlaeota bacterium]HOR65597.1 anthranilate synthase component I [Candidatus Sumerlaeota bacterium]